MARLSAQYFPLSFRISFIIKNNKVSGACSTYGGDRWEDLREGDHLEGPDVNGRIILKCIFKK
jgi:hypothetical protein